MNSRNKVYRKNKSSYTTGGYGRYYKGNTLNDLINYFLLLVSAVGLSFFAYKFTDKSERPILILVFLGILLLIIFAYLYQFYKKKKRDELLRELLFNTGKRNPMDLTPEQFEHFCAELLRRHGWKVSVTQQSKDFGADIIAKKNGKLLAVQCKQWSNSVGISAVQEIHSAKSYYKAHYAMVVSTAKYTSSARKLARETNVVLCSWEDLLSGDILKKL